MEEIVKLIIESILNAINEMPTFYKVISLSVLLFVFLYISNKNFRLLINLKIITKIKTNNNMIATNELFVSEKYFYSQITNVDLLDNHKENLFKIILKKKVHTTIEKSKEFFDKNKKNFKKWSPEIFYQEIYSLIFCIVEDYEKNIKTEFLKEYGDEKGKKIFELVYINGFKPYHFENIHLIEKQIKKILYSRIKNDYIKIYFTFTQFYIALETAIADCETVFNRFNGNLEKILK